LGYSILSAKIVSDGIIIEFQDYSNVYFSAELLATRIADGSTHLFLTDDPITMEADRSTESEAFFLEIQA
jgi:hypothetical protein